MSISNEAELTGMRKASEAVAFTLKAMRHYAQHEHTLVVTDGAPIILTEMNGVWD